MTLKVTKGRQAKALIGLLYGVEGVGKTTLASKFPSPLFLDAENGSAHLDVDRVRIHKWSEIEGAIHSLIRDAQGYKTVVVDSADWVERLAVVHLLDREKKDSIESFGFGRGWIMLSEMVSKLLAVCDQLAARGVNIVWIAHSKIVRVSPPDQTDGYDRYELKLHKNVGPLFKEWADAVLFCTFRTKMVEGDDGRMKGRGGKERIIHCERSAAWDAKNRFGLPETVPMAIESLAPLFDATVQAQVEPKRKPIRVQIAEATSVKQLGELGDTVDSMESAGTLTPEQAETARGMIAARHNELEPAAEVA